MDIKLLEAKPRSHQGLEKMFTSVKEVTYTPVCVCLCVSPFIPTTFFEDLIFVRTVLSTRNRAINNREKNLRFMELTLVCRRHTIKLGFNLEAILSSRRIKFKIYHTLQ